MNLNRIVVTGNIASDINLKDINDTHLATFSIASDHKYNDKVETTFFTVEVWGKRAKVVAEYCQKSSSLLVEGRMKQKNWETEAGQKRSSYAIMCENFVFIDSK